MSAQHKIRARWRTDWFRVIADLQYLGHPNSRVAEAMGVANATLNGWKNGSEPRHCDGVRLLALWCEVTGQGEDHRPMTRE